MVNISPALWEQLKKVPALPPPPGVTSNLGNREVPNHFEWIITAILGFTFTTILVLIRIYTKFFIIKSHGWEDCKLPYLLYSPSLPAVYYHLEKKKKKREKKNRPAVNKNSLIDTSVLAWVRLFFGLLFRLFILPFFFLPHSFIHSSE